MAGAATPPFAVTVRRSGLGPDRYVMARLGQAVNQLHRRK